MASNCLSLAAVEKLLGEFHDSRTGNDRKREIDQLLVNQQNHPEAWPESLHHLSNYGQDQYLWFFNATTVQLAISCRWSSSFSCGQRQQIRETIWQGYTGAQQPTSKMQHDKMAQLIALMGKRDFPGDHPTYMAHVLQLLGTHFEMGITLLRATSEELCSTKDDISSQRKSDFHAAMSGCMAECMDLLGRYLVVFATHIACFRSEIPSGQMPYPDLAQALPAGEEKIFTAAVDCLACVQHLLSWISLDSHLTHSLVEQLFELAKYRDVERLCHVSVASLNAITELFYRQVALPQVSSIAFGLKSIIQQPQVKKSNEMYQDKLTELLRLFATQHWREWTQSNDLPNILNALYEFTFSGYGALAFTERLAIWCPMVSGLSSSGCERYIETVQLLVSGILRKMQFRFDQESELDDLDNERLDDDNETEWQQYLRQCIETICLIAEGRPVQVFEQVYSDWQRPFEMFMSLEKSHDGRGLTITDYQRCNLIHCVTRDLASLCQCLTSLIPILHARPENMPQNVHNLSNNLVTAVAFMSATKLHRLDVTLPQITVDFVEIFAQIMSALRSFIAWSPTLHNETALKALIEQAAGVLVPSTAGLQGGEPRMITLAAAQLLLSITSVMRPKYALESTSLQQLVQAGPRLQHLDAMAAGFVHQFIVQCFVLPWSLGMTTVASTATAFGEQDMERRAMLLQEYVADISHDLLRLDDTLANGQQDKIVKITTTVLPVLSGCLGHFREHSTAVKNMLLAAYKPTIAKAISLFNQFGTANTDIADAVLNFSLTVVRTLQMQLGAGNVKEMLSIFLEASAREHITVGRLKAMDKLLQMLLLVVEQPGSTTLSLLPAILSVSLDLVQPLFGGGQSEDLADVAVSLFSLFDGILHHRWQYFYKSQVLRGFSPADRNDCSGSDAETPPQNAEQLLAILTAYGHALVGAANDPHVMRLLLNSLHSLNERYRLFGRRFFRDQLLSSFQCALINATVSPTGALHIDQLLGVLFTMGQVNMAQLHASFVALGYAKDSRAIEAVCLSVDLPTFSQQMALLIQDTKCSQLSSGAH